MANSLPPYPAFDLHSDQSSLAQRWKKWLRGFENLMVGLNIDDADRKLALLKYYAGESVHDLFETLPGIDDNSNFAACRTALNTYMEPNKNTEHHEYEFRQMTQTAGESIDAFHTRLVQKTKYCDFHDKDKEVRSQLINGTTSTHLRHNPANKITL